MTDNISGVNCYLEEKEEEEKGKVSKKNQQTAKLNNSGVD